MAENHGLSATPILVVNLDVPGIFFADKDKWHRNPSFVCIDLGYRKRGLLFATLLPHHPLSYLRLAMKCNEYAMRNILKSYPEARMSLPNFQHLPIYRQISHSLGTTVLLGGSGGGFTPSPA
jgi:hypothetical protein